MKNKRPATYESEALGVLAYEFAFTARPESDAKIRRRLQRKRLGAFDPERIARLRQLKDELQAEIGKQADSSYFVGPPTLEQRQQTYVEVTDFDIPRLTADLIRHYPTVPPAEIATFVPFAVFVWHAL